MLHNLLKEVVFFFTVTLVDPIVTDNNPCLQNPCVHGTCKSLLLGYACLCYDGYIGAHCETSMYKDYS